ncbi:TetR/AcrR family transcriptional regulator [Streptomyces violaceusniger]|uniref:TetR/AcrR family transcriptional regulator n=1 Tax=Streptomyces violaceusniger TaxID=68280 RepID=UPI00343E8516
MRTPRGPYAKSSAKRQQILDAALAAYADAGSRKVSVRDIAQRVGMTDAGVLHHFGNREALLAAVLEARDAAARAKYGDAHTDPGAGLRIVADNASTPGLVKLFVDVAAAAAEPGHPAHDWFADRYTKYRDSLTAQISDGLTRRPEAHADDPAPSHIDPEWAARILVAAVDGLQLQWLLEPGIDMAADLAALRNVLVNALRADGQPD